MKTTPSNRTIPNTTYFITTNLLERALFADDSTKQIIFDTLNFYRSRGDIKLHGFVIMPDHLHLMVRVLESQTLPRFMNGFKSYIANQLGSLQIWQKGYWSEIITEMRFAIEKLDYIHNNPVRAELVAEPADYEWSSAIDYFNCNINNRIDYIE
ncbi:transposase [bacterium]|nr:transposase [bacterium]MBU1637397.1 transposase [bacterium]